jgi:hypothetical protein
LIGSAGKPPLGIEENLHKAIAHPPGSANDKLGSIAVNPVRAHQYQFPIPSFQAHEIVQAEVFPAHADRIAITIGTAPTNPRKIKVQQ